MRSELAALLLLLPFQARAQSVCPNNSVWPSPDWTSVASQVAPTRQSQISALETYAFTLTGTDAQRAGIRTDAVIIIQHGQIIYEKYARGWTSSQPHEGWSVTKSITSALTGIAVAQGALSLDTSVCTIPNLPQTHCDMTVRALLEFSSGLDWDEGYEGGSNQSSAVIAMLYGVGHQDMDRFINAQASRQPPGASYSYSTGDATFLAGVVQAALQPKAGEEYPWKLLFEPLGMSSVVIERDAKGSPVGGAFAYATARDYARFGYFYLNDGCWMGQRLLPSGWVAQSTTINTPVSQGVLYNWSPGDVQGWQWWLNQPLPTRNAAEPWPAVPQDAYAAEGHWGQYIAVIPSKDMVVVRLGDDRDGSFELGTFLALAMAVGQ